MAKTGGNHSATAAFAEKRVGDETGHGEMPLSNTTDGKGMLRQRAMLHTVVHEIAGELTSILGGAESLIIFVALYSRQSP